MASLRREHAALLLFLLLGLLVWADLRPSPPVDPFAAPAPLALGSGQAAGGGHCAAAPGR
jgi:hypothetical protein